MKDEERSSAPEEGNVQPKEPADPPPPFEPDERLITFIERGQSPPRSRERA